MTYKPRSLMGDGELIEMDQLRRAQAKNRTEEAKLAIYRSRNGILPHYEDTWSDPWADIQWRQCKTNCPEHGSGVA